MYIDPGVGSLVLQALAAGVLSVGLAFRRSREAVTRTLHSILSRLRRH